MKICITCLLLAFHFPAAAATGSLNGTSLLEMDGDIASQLVDGVDRFLLKKIAEAKAQPGTNTHRLKEILGIRDNPASNSTVRIISLPGKDPVLGISDTYKIYEAEWAAFGHVNGTGLITIPSNNFTNIVIAIPDCAVSPEKLAGIEQGLQPPMQFSRHFAELNCMVITPVLIDRTLEKRRNATLTNRELLYRSAFVLGRHLIGYEIQKILAIVDWAKHEHPGKKVIVAGWGEGGLIAFYAAAIDSRIDATLVSGFYGNRKDIWQQPIDRNIFGLLLEFSDENVARLIAPGQLVIDNSPGPTLELESKGGGAPAILKSPTTNKITLLSSIQKVIPGTPAASTPRLLRPLPDAKARMTRQISEIDQHNQRILAESPYTRAEFMKNLKFGSIEQYVASTKPYREYFYKELIGRFDDELLPPNPRSRKWQSTSNWTAHEVVLDVFEDVIAYGIILVPNNIKEGEKRPVVVCQHGLEGRPEEVITGDHYAYHDFAAKLAERGFITFAPQNLYIFKDRFRTLQRKANPLGKSLFSIITPQHQQILNWLKTLPHVDPARIGFYGLSYGGKTAMRVPALLTDYAFSICSADFNEWVWKNASTLSPYSYVWTGEYEIFEWNLGNTFNYAEMAALIAPRPFMVERGHFDGVAPDETVAHEFAKVRHLYNAKLRIPDRTEIEWFVGPHTINGKATFDFCHKHLNWLKPK